MKIRNIGRGRFQPARSTGFVAGQQVSGRVISRLGEGLFRIGAAGQLFDAASDLPLKPGQRLTAKVEVGESRVFLRVQDEPDKGIDLPGEDRNPAEIRRVLTGLGYRPDPLEITEFQERLHRYQRYGKMTGIDPSDIWILALLWVRNIKGGAEAFSLLSYYLRQAACSKGNHYQLPQPWVLQSLLDPEEEDNGFYTYAEEEIAAGDSGRDFHTERKQEAGALLNRSEAANGRLLQARSGVDASCVLELIKNDQVMARWTDNPALPISLIEAARSQGRIRVRVHGPEVVAPDENDGLEVWEANLGETLHNLDLEIESIEYYTTQDPEVLRFLFWRRWEEDFFRNICA